MQHVLCVTVKHCYDFCTLCLVTFDAREKMLEISSPEIYKSVFMFLQANNNEKFMIIFLLYNTNNMDFCVESFVAYLYVFNWTLGDEIIHCFALLLFLYALSSLEWLKCVKLYYNFITMSTFIANWVKITSMDMFDAKRLINCVCCRLLEGIWNKYWLKAGVHH